MLQQLEQCAVRKAFKVAEVNCTGFRAGANVHEETRGEGHKPWERSRAKNLTEKWFFFQIKNGHKKVNGEPLFSHKKIK